MSVQQQHDPEKKLFKLMDLATRIPKNEGTGSKAERNSWRFAEMGNIRRVVAMQLKSDCGPRMVLDLNFTLSSLTSH